MSCEFHPIRMISRRALPFVLTLAAAPSAAFSQSFACHPIRGGETATQLARRITGDGRNSDQSWFQIVDASSRPVPKSQYDRLRPGWRACIVDETDRDGAWSARQHETLVVTDVPFGRPRPAAVDPLGSIRAADLAFVWLANSRRLIGEADVTSAWLAGTRQAIADADLTLLWLAAAVVLPLFTWKLVDDYVSRRRAVLIVMEHFARRFVREFERPLIQQPAERPLRIRLRLSPARGRLDILLAPGHGRRYPNLSDHRKNVEYDVARVLHALADDSFVRDRLHANGGWLVVSFRYDAGPKRTGAACISSF